jgi:protocatechuate 3,4-dioxygenase alpha subunit
MTERRTATPGQTIGPFFHDALSFRRDNELASPSAPYTIRLHGTVFDGAGDPIPDALVEIRQADAQGQVPTVEGSLARESGVFTGWGRCATDGTGHYNFTTVEPGPPGGHAVPFFSIVLFARGLLNRLFTRAYVPHAGPESDPFLALLEPHQRTGLIAVRQDDGNLLFDMHLQGDRETVFLTFPGHEAG